MEAEQLKEAGFESEELDKIFGLADDKENEIPELPTTAKSKKGEIYKLGSHRLLCGDALKDIPKLMGKEKANLCFTSPPYNMAGGLYKDYRDDLKSEDFIKLHIDVLKNVKKHLRGFVFWNVSYNKNTRWEFLEILYRIVKEPGMKFLELIIWDKGHGLPITSKNALTRQYEDILLVGDEESVKKNLEVFFLGKTKTGRGIYFHKKNQKGITNYWRIDTNKSQIENLKACFPVALPQKGIELMTERGDIVIDPFGGSGTTMIACEKTNRACRIVEMDPKYCDVIIKRYEAFEGRKAKKLTK